MSDPLSGSPATRSGAARSPAAVAAAAAPPILEFRNVTFHYGDVRALHGIDLVVPKGKITALIGPSGCGKSTLLRCINRLDDLVAGARLDGAVLFEGVDTRHPDVDVNGLRRRIGMVFQKSNPFPKSVYDNVAYGPRLHGVRGRARLDEIVERSLRAAALWDEVEDRLRESALGLSGGQQQRLCIARAIAVEPEVILFDEPCSALDPVATARIEDLMFDLKDHYTQVIVTHNMQQAARVSDFTAFLYLGELVEHGETRQLFTNPARKQTEDYVMGRFG